MKEHPKEHLVHLSDNNKNKHLARGRIYFPLLFPEMCKACCTSKIPSRPCLPRTAISYAYDMKKGLPGLLYQEQAIPAQDHHDE